MNERLKFRAWDKNCKEMIHNVQETYGNGCSGKGSLEHCSFGELIEDENYILMQYTGINDQTGKLIYEGDIVKEYWAMPEKESPCEVVFKDGAFVLEPIKECDIGKIFDFTQDTEVIGNVYDNPELLERWGE